MLLTFSWRTLVYTSTREDKKQPTRAWDRISWSTSDQIGLHSSDMLR